MARKNGHTQLTRGFKPWKSKLKNPPRWRKFFPSLLPLSFCLRLSRAPALPSWNFPFTSGEGCAQNVAASNAALGGWPASNRNTLFKTTHCAVCFARREKKKKKEKFAIHFHHIPRPGPYSSSIVSTFAVHETILSLSLFLSFSPSLCLCVASLCLRFVFLLKIEPGFPVRRCAFRSNVTATFPLHGIITIARLIYPCADHSLLFAN